MADDALGIEGLFFALRVVYKRSKLTPFLGSVSPT